ncbi:MAG: hypothetical protein AAF587_44855, partial [Bacteroidota bacterium]
CDLHVDKAQRYHHSIRYMLLILKSYMPRASGFNWNIQKFHEVLHTCFNILNLGHPMNYDASSGERNMKPFGIQPGLRAGNVGGDDFMVNSSNRVHENQLIHQANEELNRYNESKVIKADNEEAEPKTTLIGYPDYLLRRRGRGVIEGWRHQGKGQHKRLNPIVRRELGKFKDIETFCFYTECKVKGNLLRAHPCYNGAEWYDWVLVTSHDYEQIYPVKIVAFYSKVNDPGQIYFAYQDVCMRENEDGDPDDFHDTNIFEKHTLAFKESRPMFGHYSVDSIITSCLVIQEHPGIWCRGEGQNETVWLIKERKHWAKMFSRIEIPWLDSEED